MTIEWRSNSLWSAPLVGMTAIAPAIISHNLAIQEDGYWNTRCERCEDKSYEMNADKLTVDQNVPIEMKRGSQSGTATLEVLLGPQIFVVTLLLFKTKSFSFPALCISFDSCSVVANHSQTDEPHTARNMSDALILRPKMMNVLITGELEGSSSGATMIAMIIT